jgi:pimeloyl-ACP methyl ester carboxylesterase
VNRKSFSNSRHCKLKALTKKDGLMPHIQLTGLDDGYDLIAYDDAGVERTDDPDGCMSRRVLETIDREPVSDVFLMCHGWKESIPSAKAQFDSWATVMAESASDLSRARKRPGFRPLFVGLHWPSLPWDDAEFAPPGSGAARDTASRDAACVDTYARRIADTPVARQALSTIFQAAGRHRILATLPNEVRTAYCVLDQESGLGSAREGAPPGDDREPFDPEQRFQAARQASATRAGASDGADSLLSPLRQLSFWNMTARARALGEFAARELVRGLLNARGEMRVHLMGHSFGCIVVSAAVAKNPEGAVLPRPVQSLVLVQGDLSLWSYCSDIPYRRGTPGYFRPLVTARHVAGPVVATQSRFDKAVGSWYPLAAGAVRQIDFASGELPRYGGAGTFGFRGPDLDPVDLQILPSDESYHFRPGGFYNLESSGVIRKGSGASGAHADINHPEVAHAVWSAALA